MITQVNGQRVFYGNGSLPQSSSTPLSYPIIFLHGAGFDHSMWAMPSRYFARHGWPVIAPDLPGHGRSAGPPLTSISQMSDWVAELMQVLGAQQATLIGHSMGSLIAIETARRHSKLVTAVALLGTSVPMPVTSLLLDAAADEHPAAWDMANEWSHSFAGKLGNGTSPGICIFRAGQRWMQHNSASAFYADLAACHEYQPSPMTLTQRGLVIMGQKDRMTPPKSGQVVAQHFVDCEAVTLPGCGHAMVFEQPNEVLDVLRDFVERG